MKCKYLLNLFDDGAGAVGTTASESTVETKADNAPKSKNKNPLSNVVYGKTNDTSEASSETNEDEKNKNDVSEEDLSKEFDELVKGKYADVYKKMTSEIIQARVKNAKQEQTALQKQIDDAKPIMSMLAFKYGVNPDDVSAIAAKINADDSIFSDEATRRGSSVSELRNEYQMQTMQRQIETMAAEKATEQAARESYQRMMSQVAEAQKIYPGLDINVESNNPDFVKLMKAGIDVKTAYQVLHQDEIMSGAMQYAAQTMAQKISDSVQANQSRHKEVAAGASTPAITHKKSVKELTKADRIEIERRVMNGERIEF